MWLMAGYGEVMQNGAEKDFDYYGLEISSYSKLTNCGTLKPHIAILYKYYSRITAII